jgi:hypothetical protein
MLAEGAARQGCAKIAKEALEELIACSPSLFAVFTRVSPSALLIFNLINKFSFFVSFSFPFYNFNKSPHRVFFLTA